MSTLFEKLHLHHEGLIPSKVARKYKLLTKNPFAFFRGTNQLFYEDLARERIPCSPVSWVCGDLHLENFGSYKADNRLVYFDLNDFDESILAPVSWEIVRMITSILVAFDSLRITDNEALKACEIFLRKYSQILSEGKPRYIECQTADGLIKRFLKSVQERTDRRVLASRTVKKHGKLELSNGKHKQLIIGEELKVKLVQKFNEWMKSNNQPPNDYKVLDARFRLMGTGSMGIRRYVFLIEKIGDASKHMLIDMKQATPSSLRSSVNAPQPSWKSEADRMVATQRIMQNIPPAQLSTLDFENESFLMQELQPTKDRINFSMIQGKFKTVCSVIEDMAMLRPPHTSEG